MSGTVPPPVAAQPAPPAVPAGSRPRLRWRPVPPAAGWTSALLLTVLLAACGTILDLPMLAGTGPDGRSQTAFLVQLIPAVGLLALASSFLGLRDGVAYVVGAIAGGALVLMGTAGALSDAPDLGERLGALQASAARLFQQVFVEGTRTDETSGFLLAVGIVGAATGWFGGWNLFRRGFVSPALVSVIALVVVTCLSPLVAVEELYVPLVVLTATALLLALRAGLATRQRAWTRLGFLDPTAGTSLLLAGGTVLGIGALILASSAAARITAAPLAPAWSSIDRVPEILDEIDRIFGELGSRSLQGSGSFDDSAQIQSTWESSNAIVFSAESSDGRGYYWRGAAYDRFDGARWSATAPERRAVATGGDLAAGTADGDPLLGARRTVRFVVTAGSLGGDTLLAPAVARTADRDAVAIVDPDGGPIAELELARRLRKGDTYGVTAEIVNEGGLGLTQAKLAAAGVAYPAWALRYTRLEPGTLSDRAAGAAAAVVAELPPGRRDPFHVAQALERWFTRGGDFRYAIDVAGTCAPGEGVVDCLLRSRVGFCQHYATAMTLMLRSRAIPARYVQGYLPGRRLGDGAWAVEASAAHAWVEVWFPGWGWVRFDPTPGGNAANGQEASSLPEGRPIPTPPPDPAEPEPTPVFSDPPLPDPTPSPTPDPAVVVPPGPPSGGDAAPLLLLLAVLVVLGAFGARLAWGARLPGRDPELLWRGVANLAARAGRPARPSETPFEVADGVARIAPTVGTDVRAVAEARVAARYGRVAVPPEGVEPLVAAFRRIRRALVAARLGTRRRR